MRLVPWLLGLLGLVIGCTSASTRPERARAPAPIPSLGEVRARWPAEPCQLDQWEDGDTPIVVCGGRTEIVRMLGIDTAESGFDANSRRRANWQVELWGMTLEQVLACGQAATDRVRELCPAGEPVEVVGGERDRYGRRLAYVVCRGVELNSLLIEEGLAGRYPYPGPPERPSACPLPQAR